MYLDTCNFRWRQHLVSNASDRERGEGSVSVIFIHRRQLSKVRGKEGGGGGERERERRRVGGGWLSYKEISMAKVKGEREAERYITVPVTYTYL